MSEFDFMNTENICMDSRNNHLSKFNPTQISNIKEVKSNSVPSIMNGVDVLKSNVTENVSLNFKDFQQNFLTCTLCLNHYDEVYVPKLLPCSHTLCRPCIDGLINATDSDKIQYEPPNDNSEPNQNFIFVINCPVCRESIVVPRGGSIDFPPSFLINQLVDLMKSQRKDIIPLCKLHSSELLMYCETCDVIFCITCGEKGHGGSVGGSGVDARCIMLPFSLALKRMNEIVLYKGSLCLKNLDKANQSIQNELNLLNENTNCAIQSVNTVFDDLLHKIKKRRDGIIRKIKEIQNIKHASLNNHLKLVEERCNEIGRICNGESNYMQSNIHYVSKIVNDLNARLDQSNPLSLSRENTYISFEYKCNDSLKKIYNEISRLGKVKISTTFPILCELEFSNSAILNLETTAKVITYDCYGKRRKSGNDPICVKIKNDDSGMCINSYITDKENGEYNVNFTIKQSGSYSMYTTIFSRHIKNSPLKFFVKNVNNPISTLGKSTCKYFNTNVETELTKSVSLILKKGKIELKQPTCIRIGTDETIYILDTGSCQLKIFYHQDSETLKTRFINLPQMQNQGATSMDLINENTILMSNWKKNAIYEIFFEESAEISKVIEHTRLLEPTQLSIRPDKLVFSVLNHENSQILIFTCEGDLIGVISRSFELTINVNCLHTTNKYILLGTNTIEFYCFDIFDKDADCITEITANTDNEFTQKICSLYDQTDSLIFKPSLTSSRCNSISSLKPTEKSNLTKLNPKFLQYKQITVDSKDNILCLFFYKRKFYIRLFSSSATHIFDIQSDDKERIKFAGGIVCDKNGQLHVCDLFENVVKTFRYV
ncbi:E3 ubiquitin-protein ligase TRIM63 [Intoshia linei]|uniref:E3 ubiquitin-protein ligase TRIM63 n=1 Tax=Intoshia linei TaxID=1819745 RepID=A0A177BCI1_9BILA|nr:E3 ubiquitin-protein ligase TRIM63 [Intoshia linei]